MSFDKKIYYIKFLDHADTSHSMLIWAKGKELACESVSLNRLKAIDAYKIQDTVSSVKQVLMCELLREQSDYTTVTNGNEYIEISYGGKNYFLIEGNPVLVSNRAN